PTGVMGYSWDNCHRYPADPAMPFGPFLRKELIIAARRRDTYVSRASSAGVLLVAIGAMEACAYAFGWDRASVAGQGDFAMRVLGLVAGLTMVSVLMAAPIQVAPVVAIERDKKSLDALLTTPLTGAEVVAGKLAAGLLNFAGGTLAGVPVV